MVTGFRSEFGRQERLQEDVKCFFQREVWGLNRSIIVNGKSDRRLEMIGAGM
jgi:hypothetical protein